MQKYAGVPNDVAQRIVLPNWSEDISTTRKSTEQVMKAMLAAGMIPKEVDLRQFIADDVGRLGK